MKKSSIPLFIAAFLLPYTMIAVRYCFFGLGSNIDSVIIVLQISSVIFTCLCFKKVIPFIILTVNLCACTVVANKIGTYLYMERVSNDYGTAMVGNLETLVGGVYVVALSIVIYFLVRFLKDKFNYVRRVYNASLNSAEKYGAATAVSVFSVLFIIISMISALFAAFFHAYRNVNGFIEEEYKLLIPSDQLTLLVGILAIVSAVAVALSFLMSKFALSKTNSSAICVKLALNARLACISAVASIVASVLIIVPLAIVMSPFSTMGI